MWWTWPVLSWRVEAVNASILPLRASGAARNNRVPRSATSEHMGKKRGVYICRLPKGCFQPDAFTEPFKPCHVASLLWMVSRPRTKRCRQAFYISGLLRREPGPAGTRSALSLTTGGRELAPFAGTADRRAVGAEPEHVPMSGPHITIDAQNILDAQRANATASVAVVFRAALTRNHELPEILGRRLTVAGLHRDDQAASLPSAPNLRWRTTERLYISC